MDELNALRRFWAEVSGHFRDDVGDLEYEDFRDFGTACGLLVMEPYDILVSSGLAQAPERSTW